MAKYGKWNPVKELKALGILSPLIQQLLKWNPVKELKVKNRHILHCRSCRWNPVKELKVQDLFPRSAGRPRGGIR